jgi:hypothetical protein
MSPSSYRGSRRAHVVTAAARAHPGSRSRRRSNAVTGWIMTRSDKLAAAGRTSLNAILTASLELTAAANCSSRG